MEEKEMILDIKQLRLFTSDLDNKKYGDFYVTTVEGEYYVFLNADNLYLISHFASLRGTECISKPTEKFIKEFWNKIED